MRNTEKHYVFESLFEVNITQVSCEEQKAEYYAEMHVPVDAHFPVFVQFEGDQKASC